jgi:hypothetical protein
LVILVEVRAKNRKKGDTYVDENSKTS